MSNIITGSQLMRTLRPAAKASLQSQISKGRKLPDSRPITEPVIIQTGIQTVSEANNRDCRQVKSARAKRNRSAAYLACCAGTTFTPALPLRITLTRLGGRELDDDNLAGALKSTRDGVADFIGVDDGDKGYEWRVAQEKSKEFGVRIEIAPAAPAPHEGNK